MKKFITTFIALVIVTLAQSQVFTMYTLAADTENRGTFGINTDGLGYRGALQESGSYLFNYAYALFTPTVSGTYAFGIQDASYDPVLIVYENQTSFPTNPASNVIGFNDDWESYDFHGLVFSNPDQTLGWNINPVVDGLELSAHHTYLLAVTSYYAGETIPLPITFFAYGPAGVDIGGPVVPEPATYAAILGVVALGGALARRRRQKV